MGIQGKGLYASPVAARVKSDIGNWLAVSTSLDSTVEKLRERFHADEKPTDAESAEFWLAMADQLHRYGLKDRRTSARARELIDRGLDLKLRAGRESDDELRERERMLKRLRDKWDAPAARPSKPPSLKPERFIMRAGEVFAYPTMGGNPNALPPDAAGRRNRGFRPDAENAFVCYRTARVFFDREARYFVIPLSIFTDGSVTMEDVVAARMISQCDVQTRWFRPLGGWAHLTTAEMKQIGARKIGEVDPNPETLVPHFGQTVLAPLSREDGPHAPLKTNLGVQSTVLRGGPWGAEDDTLECFVKAWHAV